MKRFVTFRKATGEVINVCIKSDDQPPVPRSGAENYEVLEVGAELVEQGMVRDPATGKFRWLQPGEGVTVAGRTAPHPEQTKPAAAAKTAARR